MKKCIFTLLAITALGSALGGCVVEPVDGVSVGYGQGVVLHHGGEAPVVVQQAQPVQVQPIQVQPAPVVVEHEHDRYREYHDNGQY